MIKYRILPLPIFVCVLSYVACSKPSSTNGGTRNPIDPADTTVTVKPQTDPNTAATIGFFMDSWVPKIFQQPATSVAGPVVGTPTATVAIDRSEVLTKVPQTIYGNNANLWMTQIITQPLLMNHLKAMQPKILRFPGGSISDVFFWDAEKNNRPGDVPPNLINAEGNATNSNWWYGKNNDDWTLSLNNYYNLLIQTNSTGIITINYGYARYGTSTDPVAAAAHYAANWVRHDNGRTKYWEIGNENFGHWEAGYRINTAANKDGQPEFASGDLYGRHFKVFSDSMKSAAAAMGKTIYIGAVLFDKEPENWETSTVKTWNTGVLRAVGNTPDYYIVHNYYTAYNTNAGPDEILATPIPVTKGMVTHVKQQMQAAGLAVKPIVLDEFNIFSTGSKQQVSHINGLHATLVLGESIANNFGLTARWDLANAWDNGNDHGMFNQGDEPDGVPRWNPRPAYYHMLFFERFMGDRMVRSSSTQANLISYASSFSSGEMGLVLVNTGNATQATEIKIANFLPGINYYYYTITGDTDNAPFSRKVVINGKGSTYAAGGPANPASVPAYKGLVSAGIKVSIPPKSAVYLAVEKKP